jgi:hypothetical protein
MPIIFEVLFAGADPGQTQNFFLSYLPGVARGNHFCGPVCWGRPRADAKFNKEIEEDVEVSYLFKYLIFFARVVQWQ